jgi:hypothetical protein
LSCTFSGVCTKCDATSMLAAPYCIPVTLDDCPPPGQTGLFYGNAHLASTTQCAAPGKTDPEDKAQCDQCNSCPVGRVRSGCSGFTPGTCHQCDPGFYKDIVGIETTPCAKCTVCAADSYAAMQCNSVHDSVCSPCPANSTSAEGSVGADACRCKSGFFKADGDRCVPCTAAHCDRCSATGCYKCVDSFYVRDGACVATCDSGEYGALIDALDAQSGWKCVTCEQCPRGFGMSGCGGRSPGARAYCEPGTFVLPAVEGTPHKNQSCVACTPCQEGYYATILCHGAQDSTCAKCEHCAPGTYRTNCGIEGGSSGTSPGKCVRCPDGTFKDWFGLFSDQCKTCWKCDVNMWMASPCTAESDTGRCMDCKQCPSGQYETRSCTMTSDAECATCPSCPAGFQISPKAGGDASKVEDLDCGTAENPTARGVCVPCEAGRFKAARYLVPTGGGSVGDKSLIPALWNELCIVCTPCGADEFTSETCMATKDNVCQPCSAYGTRGVDWFDNAVTGQCEKCLKCSDLSCVDETTGAKIPCNTITSCSLNSNAVCGTIAIDPDLAAQAKKAG